MKLSHFNLIEFFLLLFSGFVALVPCISWVTLRSQGQKTCTSFEYCEHLVLGAGRLSGESISYYFEMEMH